MSWSIYEKGKPATVKANVVEKFDSAKRGTTSVPVENETVVLAEQITNKVLDVLIASDYAGVDIKAWGSGSTDNPPNWKGVVSFHLEISPLQVLE